MFLLKDYKSTGTVIRGYGIVDHRASMFHGIPMGALEVAKILLANIYPNQKFRIRYRGSRIANDGRSSKQKRQDCTKATASSFSIYYR